MDYIDRFVAALDKIDAPILRAIRPGLTRSELQEVLERTQPKLCDEVDDVIASWWSWQNGVDLKLSAQIIASDERYQIIDALGPNAIGLGRFDDLLGRGSEEMWVEGRNEGESGGAEAVRFPIGFDEFGTVFGLERRGKERDWEVVWIGMDREGWFPIADHSPGVHNFAAPTTFADYLTTITADIQSGKISVQPWGGVAPGNPF